MYYFHVEFDTRADELKNFKESYTQLSLNKNYCNRLGESYVNLVQNSVQFEVKIVYRTFASNRISFKANRGF